jgi:hypothetical protein
MGIVKDIVREQVAFLRPRGFGVLGMGNTEGPAMFERQLTEKLEELIHDDLEWIVPMPVQAINIGKFEKGKYTVQFTFDYEFEPLHQQLTLIGIEARLGEDTMPITMQDLREYCKAETFFLKLKNIHAIVEEHNQQQFEATLSDLIKKNKELLRQQGYTKMALGNKKSIGSIERRLERKLAEAVAATTDQKPIQRFKIPASGIMGKDDCPVDYVIFFEFNRNHPWLRPDSVTAKAEGKTVVLECNSNIPLPSADSMYQLATGKLDMKKALALLRYKHDYSLKRVKGVSR